LIVDCLRADRAFAQARACPEGFLARVSAAGRSFTNAVTVCPTTTPAVATMLTGCYPFEHGLRGLSGFSLPQEIPTIAGTLRGVGYRTEARVTGPLLRELGLFDEFDDYVWTDGHAATLHGPRGDELARWIGSLREAAQPWFAAFHVWDLHEPRQVPAGAVSRLSRTVYDRALAALDLRLDALLPRELLEDVVVIVVGDHGENLRLEPRRKLGKGVAGLLWWKWSRPVMQPLARALVARGARSSSKRALRLAPRALITHGHHLFEPLIRVPYLLSGPGVPPGTSAALVTHTDLAPTIAELAGTWIPGGVGAIPLPLHSSDGEADRRIVLETAWVTALAGVPQVGLRTPRWKFMELPDGSYPALFDLEADPSERRNRVGELPDLAREFHDELQTMLATGQYGRPMSERESELVETRLRDLGYFN
jgi:arylsulfatase A-like enzyme